jgi:hypothetical protein
VGFEKGFTGRPRPWTSRFAPHWQGSIARGGDSFDEV